jgi:5-methylcytosine-specific restriction endonuclease McrA
MTNDIVNKAIVLKLNASWLPVRFSTIKDAIIDLTGGESSGGHPKALALDIDYAKKEDGEWDFENPLYMNPVGWEIWKTLPIRPFDIILHTAKLEIRAPLVVIAANYNKVPYRKPRATKAAIMERDGMICQYTGRKLSRKELNVDHIIPVSRGGKNTFSNMVACDIKINLDKADRTPKEAGLELIRIPKEPPSTPVSTTLKEIRHPTWAPFLISKK